MKNQEFIDLLARTRMYDLTQPLSIYTPPWPGDKALEVHFFKRVTGAYGGGQGANGQILNWSNTTGTHLVGEKSFHSGARAISDIPLKELAGQGVVADISGQVSDYSLYSPEMIMKVAEVIEGDILLINTGYHKYSWEKPDSSEFGYLVKHPGPSPDFFDWAIKMKLKWVGIDCGSIEHPMNTPIRYMHQSEFEKAEEKLKKEHGKSWDEMFPPEDYYELMHIKVPDAHLVFVESIGGDIDELKKQRVWLSAEAIPFMETEAAWARIVAYVSPEGMNEDDFFAVLEGAEKYDLTLPFSVQTPQWLNYVPLSVSYHKRVGGQQFGMGRNGSICNASIHLATHMDGEIHFYPAGRRIGQVPLEEWVGAGVIADISEVVSNSSVYTPAMIEKVVDIRRGDILIINTGWHKYGWNSPESDEFRYMVKHPGPSPDFAQWSKDMKIKWIGVDCVSADHPMNTIMRIWHPKTFAEADSKLKRDFGKDWDEMYPLDKYYQDMHLNLFPHGIVHAENLGGDMSMLPSGRYYLGAFLARAMEAESMWGRFIAWKYPE